MQILSTRNISVITLRWIIMISITFDVGNYTCSVINLLWIWCQWEREGWIKKLTVLLLMLILWQIIPGYVFICLWTQFCIIWMECMMELQLKRVNSNSTLFNSPFLKRSDRKIKIKIDLWILNNAFVVVFAWLVFDQYQHCFIGCWKLCIKF